MQTLDDDEDEDDDGAADTRFNCGKYCFKRAEVHHMMSHWSVLPLVLCVREAD